MAKEVGERSDADIVDRKPLKLKFGEVEYEVPILNIGKSRTWREGLVKAYGEILTKIGQPAAGQNSMDGLLGYLLTFPETTINYVFDYAGDKLPKEAILDEATDEQVARAFSQIMRVAFPFFSHLAMVQQLFQAGKN